MRGVGCEAGQEIGEQGGEEIVDSGGVKFELPGQGLEGEGRPVELVEGCDEVGIAVGDRGGVPRHVEFEVNFDASLETVCLDR